ncbi:MAG: tail fiber domain-containing protein [Verrucomicrobiota bacterium]
MKKILNLTLSSSLLFSVNQAQAQTVPGIINYQARITDANGLLIGSTGPANAPQAAPVNRKIRFRIYDVATGGTAASRKWSEEQTVTVSLGEISVLLGDNQGIAVAGEANPASFASVFTNLTGTSAARYLSIMVDNGNDSWGAEDVEVTPRQQITPTGFAFRAKVAESLASGGIASILAPLQLVGTGTSGATGIFQASGSSENAGLMLRDSAGAERAFLATVGANGALSSSAISGDTVMRVPGGNKLILQNGGDAPGLVLRDNKLGIGNAAPSRSLHIGDPTVPGTASLIRLSARATTGPRNRDWDIGVLSGEPATDPSALSFVVRDVQHGSTPAFMVQMESGNVGIGTNKPEAMLDVRGDVKSFGSISAESALLGNNARVLGTGGYAFKNGGDTDGGLFSPGDGIVTLQTNNNERLRVNGDGNVGIGTNAPNARLDVAGTLRMNENDVLLRGGTDVYAGLGWYNNIRKFDTLSTFDGPVLYGSGGGSLGTRSASSRNIALTWSANGTVGIGSNAPNDAKLTVTGTGPNPRTINLGLVFLSEAVSIYTTGAIHTSVVRSASDGRIKNVQGRSDGVEDLRTLQGLGITNYTYKDTFTNGSGSSKKVIAQEVEKVFPQAVRKTTGAVPDIFKKGAVSGGGWVTLDTDLKVGERVRLVADHSEGVHEVLEVGDGKFRTGFLTDEAEVFVYGREVKDFRTVDYDAISMLNVSATQQLKREKDEEIRLRDVRIADLEARLSQLASRDKEQETRLARLEKALAADTPPSSAGAESATRTASR